MRNDHYSIDLNTQYIWYIRSSKKNVLVLGQWISKKGQGRQGFYFLFLFPIQHGKGFYFQQFKNIMQTSSILFWQTNNAIVFTLLTGRIVHRTICLERNCTLKLTRTVFSLVAMLNFYFRFRLISHSNVCQNSSASPECLKT